jgi:D-alanyl-D-alanine carboxypeptidase/D-alanyl-D-alanine-endopeptidase (penicillin-binding protein 4)
MIRTALVLLMWSISSTLFASNFQKPIDNIIQNIDPKLNLGMLVVDLTTGETLYQRAIKQPFIPASNMKLFSDATALLALGPDYHFQTQLSTDADSIQNGTLNGSLYLTLPGDPSFSSTNLQELFASLKNLGVSRIAGSVILVSDFSHTEAHPPGIVPKDLYYSYGASLAPLIIDENRVTITVNPSCQIGQPALVEYSGPLGSFILNNQVTTVAGSAGGVSFSTTNDNHLLVQGKIGQRQGAVQGRIAIKNPLAHAQELIKVSLQAEGIALDGPVLLGQSKPSMLLATHYSQPITRLLADTLKPSDNLYANSLFLHAARKIHGAPVNWQEAETVVKQFLQQQTGINMQSAVLIDGSGLSRHDLLSTEQTVSLLRYLYERFPLTYEYIAALPISGQDGTLKRRLRKPTQKGFIRAKTGTMTGVMSLSGYLYTANGHTLAFAIFINTRHGTPPNISGRYRSMVDSLCDFLLRQKPTCSSFFTFTKTPQSHVAYQQHPSDADKSRQQIGKWRQIEFLLKQSLQNRPITILFRDNQLVIVDRSTSPSVVWSSLQKINSKYKIAVALKSTAAPEQHQSPKFLWIPDSHHTSDREWIIHEEIG